MPEPKPHILVVDDDDRLRALLKKYLSEQGFMVTAAADAASARRQLAWFAFDLAVFDVMMPGESGLELLASLKSPPGLPVLMLSAMGEPRDRIKGLATGAEDYLAKPFEPEELVLRVRAILRRQAAEKPAPKIIAFGKCRFDPLSNLLTSGRETIDLTSGEATMLRALAARPGQPLSREELAAAMPGAAGERSVDVQITRLRKKIEDGAGKPRYLQTVRGKGYALYADAAEDAP